MMGLQGIDDAHNKSIAYERTKYVELYQELQKMDIQMQAKSEITSMVQHQLTLLATYITFLPYT